RAPLVARSSNHATTRREAACALLQCDVTLHRERGRAGRSQARRAETSPCPASRDPRTPNCPAASQTTPEGAPVRLPPGQPEQGNLTPQGQPPTRLCFRASGRVSDPRRRQLTPEIALALRAPPPQDVAKCSRPRHRCLRRRAEPRPGLRARSDSAGDDGPDCPCPKPARGEIQVRRR